MRCPSAKSKRWSKWALVFGCLQSTVSLAVDDKLLWLPAKHAKLFLDLKQAAENAETLERCVTVLNGTIDLDQSVQGRPVFRILCRQGNHKTYNEMVDGVTFETLTTKIDTPTIPPEDMAEAARLAEERRKAEEKAAEIETLWEHCEKAIAVEAQFFRNFAWAQVLPPEPQVSASGSTEFLVDFDTQNASGVALHYRVYCEISPNTNALIEIRPRGSP